MSRLIDADAFKAYIRNAYEQVKHMYPDGGKWARQITEDFCKDIDEQPTIEPQKWIPVSERLPKQQQTVLIQDFGEITIGYLNAENRWKDLTNLDDDLKGVNAWMPLPEPWKEGRAMIYWQSPSGHIFTSMRRGKHMSENNELFTDVYALEEAALNGLITLETFLNEYKRLTQTGGEENE